MLISNIDQKNILVVGDVILDKYVVGDVLRISPEAPVPVLKYLENRYVLGGAANLAANLIGGQQNVYLMSVIGMDTNGDRLLEMLTKFKINHQFLIRNQTKKTTLKTRFLAQSNQQMLRVDEEDAQFITERQKNLFIEMFNNNCHLFDLVIISDYMNGVLEYDFTQCLIKLCQKKSIPLFVDPKDQRLRKYENSTLLKPNIKDLKSLINSRDQTQRREVFLSLKKELHLQYLVVTLGSEGVAFLDQDDNFCQIATKAKAVYDVTGAGDTFLAYLAVGFVNGLQIVDSIKLANVAAGIQVGKIGTSVVYLEEISEILNNSQSIKLKSLAEIKKIIKSFAGKKKIIFTNGCFDLLHPGHISLFEKAKALGDILIVAINSDLSVKKIKGQNRPINSLEKRIKVLAGLTAIDYLVVFDDERPDRLIKEIEPDLLVKGGDYQISEVIGKDIVEKYGGSVEIIPYVDGDSTTNIIERILNLYGER